MQRDGRVAEGRKGATGRKGAKGWGEGRGERRREEAGDVEWGGGHGGREGTESDER